MGTPTATLRPSEQAPYFDVVETNVAIAGPATPLCVADKERVALVLAPAGGGAINVSTRPDAAANQGGRLISGNFAAEFYQSLSGPACTFAWFGASAAATVCNVFEVFLRRFPGNDLEGLTS